MGGPWWGAGSPWAGVGTGGGGRARGRLTALRSLGWAWGGGPCESPPVPRACPAEMAGPQRFVGSSRVAWNGLALPLSMPWPVRIMFRTRHPRGLLLRAGTGGRLTLILQVGTGEAWGGHRGVE